jgi:hypothetical protein
VSFIPLKPLDKFDEANAKRLANGFQFGQIDALFRRFETADVALGLAQPLSEVDLSEPGSNPYFP